MARLSYPSLAVLSRGFTLLEIMVVLAIMAVVTAMVIPNLFLNPAGVLEDEGHHLRRLLSLASEEAQLTGIPVRWTAKRKAYYFSSVDAEGKWLPMREHPFTLYELGGGVELRRVIQQEHIPMPGENPDKNTEDNVLGHLIFFPDGMLTLADITLSTGDAVLNIQVRPGAGGIQVVP